MPSAIVPPWNNKLFVCVTAQRGRVCHTVFFDYGNHIRVVLQIRT
jgi:hypothetical protein